MKPQTSPRIFPRSEWARLDGVAGAAVGGVVEEHLLFLSSSA
jgi:hypothetical protein